MTFWKKGANQGMVLAAAVMLITFAAIAVLGVTVFLVERLRQVDSEEAAKESVYLATAGIERAIYDYRFHDLTGNGYFSLGRTFVDGSRYFVIGGTMADLLMVDTSDAQLSGNNRTLSGIDMQNATNTRSATISQMRVSWNNSAHLTRIRIGNKNVWSKDAASPVTATLSPQVTLDKVPSTVSIAQMRFSSAMSGANIDVRFIMTDGSFKDARLFPASNNFNFTVPVTGKAAGSSVYRTVRAVYNARTGHIIQQEESDSEVTP